MENKLNRISAIYQLLKVAVIVLTIILVSSTTATCKNYYFSTSIGMIQEPVLRRKISQHHGKVLAN